MTSAKLPEKPLVAHPLVVERRQHQHAAAADADGVPGEVDAVGQGAAAGADHQLLRCDPGVDDLLDERLALGDGETSSPRWWSRTGRARGSPGRAASARGRRTAPGSMPRSDLSGTRTGDQTPCAARESMERGVGVASVVSACMNERSSMTCEWFADDPKVRAVTLRLSRAAAGLNDSLSARGEPGRDAARSSDPGTP